MKSPRNHPFDWLDSLHHTDPAFVEQADPANAAAVVSTKKQRHRLPRRVTAIIAATLALCLLGGMLALFIPYSTTPPDISRYEDSDYYAIMQSINTLSFTPPRYKNGFDKLMDSLLSFRKAVQDGFNSATGDAAAPGDAGLMNGAPGYTEVTDNQVAGVIEADLFKCTSTHIYYLNYENAETITLRAYTIAGEESAFVGSYDLLANLSLGTCVTGAPELYLSADGLVATVLFPYTDKSNSAGIAVLSLDISAPSHITPIEQVFLTGGYISSRMIDGSLLLVSEFVVTNADFDDESTFVPQIDTGDGFESLSIEDIEVPEGATHARYTVITKLTEGDLSLVGSKAFFSYTDDVYVTTTHIYLARVYFDYSKPLSSTTSQYTYRERNSMTEIRCLEHIGDTVELSGSVTVRGYIENQYSLDEYEGILRVVTTTNATDVRDEDGANFYGIVNSNLQSATGGMSNASLYCIDTATWTVVAEVIDFAPPGEEVRSVRFDSHMAYVCTAIEVSDPIFFFDLSDLDAITVKDTGTIDGFSHSLVNFGDGYLLGIGQGAYFAEFKAEIYEETPDGVRSVDAFSLTNVEFTEDYKAYFINRDQKLLGFGVTTLYQDYKDTNSENTTASDRYILLQFNGYTFNKLLDIHLPGSPEVKRATLIDGYLYMLSGDYIEVRPIN